MEKPPSKVGQNNSNPLPLTASTAQMAQTEEFMFQNVAYRPTVYRTGSFPEGLVDTPLSFIAQPIRQKEFPVLFFQVTRAKIFSFSFLCCGHLNVQTLKNLDIDSGTPVQ